MLGFASMQIWRGSLKDCKELYGYCQDSKQNNRVPRVRSWCSTLQIESASDGAYSADL